MMTLDVAAFFVQPLSARVCGFQHGYNHWFDPLGDLEYLKGWSDGALLRLEEMYPQSTPPLQPRTT